MHLLQAPLTPSVLTDTQMHALKGKGLQTPLPFPVMQARRIAGRPHACMHLDHAPNRQCRRPAPCPAHHSPAQGASVAVWPRQGPDKGADKGACCCLAQTGCRQGCLLLFGPDKGACCCLAQKRCRQGRLSLFGPDKGACCCLAQTGCRQGCLPLGACRCLAQTECRHGVSSVPQGINTKDACICGSEVASGAAGA